MASSSISQTRDLQYHQYQAPRSLTSAPMQGFGPQGLAPSNSLMDPMQPIMDMDSYMDLAGTGGLFGQTQQQHTAYSQDLDLLFAGTSQLRASQVFSGVSAWNTPTLGDDFGQQLQQDGSQSGTTMCDPHESSPEEATFVATEPVPKQEQELAEKKAIKKGCSRNKRYQRDSRKKPRIKIPDAGLAARQRAKTEAEKKQRAAERLMRNRDTAAASREKQKKIDDVKDRKGDQLEAFHAKTNNKYRKYFPIGDPDDEKLYEEDRKKRWAKAAAESVKESANEPKFPEVGPAIIGPRDLLYTQVQSSNTGMPTQPTEAHHFASPQGLDTFSSHQSAYGAAMFDVPQGEGCRRRCIRCHQKKYQCSPTDRNVIDGHCTACRDAGVPCERIHLQIPESGGPPMHIRTTVGGGIGMRMRTYNGMQLGSSSGQGTRTVGNFRQNIHEQNIRDVVHNYAGYMGPINQFPILHHAEQTAHAQCEPPAEPQPGRRRANGRDGPSVCATNATVPENSTPTAGSASTEVFSDDQDASLPQQDSQSSNTALDSLSSDPTLTPELPGDWYWVKEFNRQAYGNVGGT